MPRYKLKTSRDISRIFTDFLRIFLIFRKKFAPP
nr:MAG TPA: hypothetical protein [Caudoviricetes sp.]